MFNFLRKIAPLYFRISRYIYSHDICIISNQLELHPSHGYLKGNVYRIDSVVLAWPYRFVIVDERRNVPLIIVDLAWARV